MRNWGKLFEINEVRLPDIILGDLEIYSVRVLELHRIFVGWSICGRNKWESRESRNLFVDVSWS